MAMMSGAQCNGIPGSNLAFIGPESTTSYWNLTVISAPGKLEGFLNSVGK